MYYSVQCTCNMCTGYVNCAHDSLSQAIVLLKQLTEVVFGREATLSLSDDVLQEGQHPLTGQRAPPISGAT